MRGANAREAEAEKESYPPVAAQKSNKSKSD